jgi:hypothetical protein
MPQQRDNARWESPLWSGTVEQLIRAAALCVARLREAGSDPEIEIEVLERPGFSRTLDALDDLTFDDQELKNITDIEIALGGRGLIAPSAWLNVSQSDGLKLRLAGPNRTWTGGLRSEVIRILAPRPVVPRWLTTTDWVAAPIFLALVALAVAGPVLISDAHRHHHTPAETLEVVIAAVLPGLTALALVVIPSRLRRLELLRPGQDPAYYRHRRVLGGWVAALVVGVAASLIAGLVH